MAFINFTDNKIKNMDVNNIPEKFLTYFSSITEERQREIAELRPDLIEKITGKQNITTPEADNTIEVDEAEAELDPIVEAWEDMPMNVWLSNKEEVFCDVVVCKLMPQKTTICKRHHIPMILKNLRLAKGKAGIYGYFCPECVDFYLEDNKLGSLLNKVKKYNIPTVIQPLELTLEEWKVEAAPIEINDDDIIYIPDVWLEQDMVCPLHPEIPLTEEAYTKKYKERHVDFDACYCESCKRIIMRNSKAQQLDDDCAEIGIPAITFKPQRKEKIIVPVATRTIKPSYFVYEGVSHPYGRFKNTEIDWTLLADDDTLVVSYDRFCSNAEHDTEDMLCIIRVLEKNGLKNNYLVPLGYCEICDEYHITKEDYDTLYEIGLPQTTIIMEVDGEYLINSGSIFKQEQDHLAHLEKKLDDEITSLENSPNYISKYTTIKGGYDDGELHYKKNLSEGISKKIKEYDSYKPVPYTYRTDIVLTDKTKSYYLGIDDIIIDDKTEVISTRSDLGRALVNYRYLTIPLNGYVYDVKRRRQFEIKNANLYGYSEQSSDDVVFQKGITDPFLINVLNTRKKQHHLIDIIATIQQNQDAIIDRDYRENLIVQGCAGSGKTMVLLHRLSILKYKVPNFKDLNVIILTPNDHFNTHIAGLAESIQIGYVERRSVEKYYLDFLEKYDKSFHMTNKISDEMNVNQIYVDYVYSDEFRQLMDQAYSTVLLSYQDYYESVGKLSATFNRPVIPYKGRTGKDMFFSLLNELQSISVEIEKRNNQYQILKRNYIEANKTFLSTQQTLTTANNNLQAEIAKQTSLALKLISVEIENLNKNIRTYDDEIQEHMEEITRLDNSLLVINRTRRIGTEKAQITRLEKKKVVDQDSIAFLSSIAETTDIHQERTDFIDFLDKVAPFIKSILDLGTSVDQRTKELISAQAEYMNAASSLKQAKIERDDYKLPENDSEFLALIKELEDTLKAKTPKSIYSEIYEIASKKADDILIAKTGKSYINAIRGTHRYDLYLQLLFALKFFNGPIGDNEYICVDEGQDLAVNEYKLIKEVNKKSPIFNIYGDTKQLLKYGRGISDWKQIEKEVIRPSHFELRENYRNTNQITDFCNATFKMDMILTGVDGRKVKEISRITLEKELEKLKIKDDRIAIIIPRVVKKKEDYVDKESLPFTIREKIVSEYDNGKIAVMYVDEIKGVEFDKVFVVPNGMTKNEKYIAYTRALSELIIVDDESLNIKKEKPKGQKPVSKSNDTSNTNNVEDSDLFKKITHKKDLEKQKKAKVNDKTNNQSVTKPSNLKKDSSSILSEDAANLEKETGITATDFTKPTTTTIEQQTVVMATESSPLKDNLPLEKLTEYQIDISPEQIAFLSNQGIKNIGQFRKLTEKKINNLSTGSLSDLPIKMALLEIHKKL